MKRIVLGLAAAVLLWAGVGQAQTYQTSAAGGSGGGSSVSGVGTPGLPHWLSSNGTVGLGEVSGYCVNKTAAIVGDSTSTEPNDPGLHSELRLWNYPGGELENNLVSSTSQILDDGSNGAGLGAFLADGVITKNYAYVIAQHPDLIVFSYGINDVRINSITRAQLTALLTTAVNRLLAAMPTTDIVLRTPNSFLTTDPGSYGYIVPPTISVTNAQNNGSGLVRLTLASSQGEVGTVPGTNSMATGNSITVASVGGVTGANGTFPITIIDANTIDLQGSTFSGAYTSGGTAVGTLADTAQNYSTLLKAAYAPLANVWPNVVLLDMQELVFGTISPATSPFMANQLHPSNYGYNSIAMQILRRIGCKPAFSSLKAEQARQTNPTNPWAVYPREVEDPAYYDLIFKGQVQGVTANAGNIAIHTQTSVGLNDPYVGDIYARDLAAVWPGDLVQIGANAPWAVPSGFNKAVQANDILQINSLGGSLPPTSYTAAMPVKIWRPKFYHYLDRSGDAPISIAGLRDIQGLLGRPRTYPYVSRFLAGGGSTYSTLSQLPGEPTVYQHLPQAGDILVAPGVAPITLTGGGLTYANGYIQINAGSDWSTIATAGNRIAFLFSTSPDKRGEESAGPTGSLYISGALSSASPAYAAVSRAGNLTRINGNLITTSSSGSVVITLSDVYTSTTIATVTFAATQGTGPTIAWNSGSGYRMRAPTAIKAVVTTAGTGAADALVSFDVQ